MKNFKPGQRVVFTTARLRLPRQMYEMRNCQYNLPKENEIVTVVKASTSEGHWIIREYLVSKSGTLQGLSDLVLFPIEEIHGTFTEEILNEIERNIYKLPEPLTVKK